LERAARAQSNCAGPVPAPLPTGCRSCTNDINRFEALSRWRHPNLGATVPGTFIPLAEEIGLIVRLGEWVVREACATAVLWPGDLRVAVNLSVAQSKNSGPRLGQRPCQFEIAGRALRTRDIAATLAKRALSCSISCALGVRIALDDFGTGILGSAIGSASRSRRSRLIVHPERNCRECRFIPLYACHRCAGAGVGGSRDRRRCRRPNNS